MKDIIIPKPCKKEVEKYLKRWDELENYSLQEKALDELFFKLVPTNNKIENILIKASCLNDFYSTNIFSIYPVAKHILELKIDKRLNKGDTSLVNDIAIINIGNRKINFYSFATKYCSHHKPLDYPIYDNYVEQVLCYFKRKDKFYDFKKRDLKNYDVFKTVLLEFKKYYQIDEYNLKQLDKYLWLLGKGYFPKKY